MHHRNALVALCLILVLFGVTNLTSVKGYSEQSKKPFSPLHLNSPHILLQENATIPKVLLSNVIVDGNITLDEYEGSFFESNTTIMVFWEHDGAELSVGLISPGVGWVALGIGEEMNNSNIIMGGSAINQSYCYDLVGEEETHFKDTNRGGTEDILEYAATENETHTILEFVIPLDSGDELDQLLLENMTYGMFFAYHDTDDGYTIITARSEAYTFLISSEVILPPVVEPLEVDKLSEYPRDLKVGENISYGIKCINHHDEPLYNLSFIEDVNKHKEYIRIINASSTLPNAEVNYTETKVDCSLPIFPANSEFWIWTYVSLIKIKTGTLNLEVTNVSYAFANGTMSFSLSNKIEFTVTEPSDTDTASALPTADVLIPILENFDNEYLISGIALILPLIFLIFTSFILSKKRKS